MDQRPHPDCRLRFPSCSPLVRPHSFYCPTASVFLRGFNWVGSYPLPDHTNKQGEIQIYSEIRLTNEECHVTNLMTSFPKESEYRMNRTHASRENTKQTFNTDWITVTQPDVFRRLGRGCDRNDKQRKDRGSRRMGNIEKKSVSDKERLM
ncbi:unnamed protein product [Lactuca virosa]|uniref:Uncharacterized protein n=1 Tax=Lactuca virosa TaxID=75947 RepID=A0AAU9MZT7_9ASTR|nr:unnamed protein product [Lactuca virosa]